jgi:hypothetical protein
VDDLEPERGGQRVSDGLYFLHLAVDVQVYLLVADIIIHSIHAHTSIQTGGG